MSNEDRVLAIQAGENVKENLERLYYDNMGLWVYTLKPYSGYLEMEELKQQAFLSIADAVKYYNPARGSFENLAIMIIQQDIPVYLSTYEGLAVTQLYMKRKGQYRKLVREGYSREEIGQIMGLPDEAIDRLAVSVVSLNYTSQEDEMIDTIQAPENTEEETMNKCLQAELWGECKSVLKAKDYDIIYSIFVRGELEKTIAKRLKVSNQYVSKWKKKVLRRLAESEILQNLAQDYDFVTKYYWAVGLKSFKQTGTSCVEKSVIEREKLEQKKDKVLCRSMMVDYDSYQKQQDDIERRFQELQKNH